MNPDFDLLQTYNAKDSINTLRLLHVLKPQLSEPEARVYRNLLDLQGAALYMSLKGILLNPFAVSSAKESLQKEMDLHQSNLDFIAGELTGQKTLNPNSGKQLREFLVDRLGVEPVVLSFKGQRRETWNREALEKIAERDELISPVIDQVLAFRDAAKTHQFLSTPSDGGRMYASWNVGGTNTWRWSSSESAFWNGTNLQNITEYVRKIFIADPGYKLLNIDISTGDSRIVALDMFARLGDDRYLQTCMKDDLHTEVAKLVWPDLDWPDDPKAQRALAEKPYYRHFDRRFMCKKLGHGTNYYGKPWTLSRQAKVPIEAVKAFQPIYFRAFGIDLWQLDVIDELQRTHQLTNVYGFPRYFHGRTSDDATIRAAIAYLGQSGTSCTINRALLRIFLELPSVQILAQVHDSILLQYPESQPELIPLILEKFQNPISVTHHPTQRTKTYTLPIDATTGWNWGKYATEAKKKNPDGLVALGDEDRAGRYYDPGAPLLDRRIS